METPHAATCGVFFLVVHHDYFDFLAIILSQREGNVNKKERCEGRQEPPRLSLPSAFLDRKGETFRFYISAEKPPARECGGEITSHGVLDAIKHAIVHPYGASNREAR